MSLRAATLTCLLVTPCFCGGLLAQTPTTGREGLLQDPSLPVRLGSAIVRTVVHAIARTAQDTTSTPWTVDIPPSMGPGWFRLRERLFEVVRAREVTPADSVAPYIAIQALEQNGDTVTLKFVSGVRWLCPGAESWKGEYGIYEATIVHYGTAWGGVASEQTGRGNSAPCHRQ